jgi:hypothetical protein
MAQASHAPEVGLEATYDWVRHEALFDLRGRWRRGARSCASSVCSSQDWRWPLVASLVSHLP